MLQMSFYYTTTAVKQRTKIHTLRDGWKKLKPGRQFEACVKVRGIPSAEVEVLATCELESTARRPLNSITQQEVIWEGFPDWTPTQFVQWFCQKMKLQPTYVLTFLKYKYLD